MAVAIAAQYAAGFPGSGGKLVGWFAPEYKFLSEPYAKLRSILAPIMERR